MNRPGDNVGLYDATRVFFTKQRDEKTIMQAIDNVKDAGDVKRVIRWAKASKLPSSSIKKIAQQLEGRFGNKFPDKTVNKIRNLNLKART
jgi:hypothetical protein